jgi:hypothetical protein
VVVGERDTVNAEAGQRVNRPRRRTEVEHAAGHWFAARGDAALEVEHEEIGVANDLDELRGEERVLGIVSEALGDAAAEHGVAGEGELQDPKPCSP